MLSSAASSGGAPSRLERLKRWYRSETIDPVKRACNLVRACVERERRERKNQSVASSKINPFAHLSSPLFPTHQQSLLRAVGLFVGGVIVARNFGEAFNV